MPNKKTLASMIAVLTVICGFLTATHAFAASKVKVLYSFKDNGTDGRAPIASLIFDAAGNLYGTTGAGGATNKGTVFELKHAHGPRPCSIASPVSQTAGAHLRA
jgi:uncharacterized repeat protein (TIGR03803 family)